AVIETKDGFYTLQDGKLIPTSDQKEKNVKQFYYGKSGAKWVFRATGISWQKGGQVTNYQFSLPPEYLASTHELRVYEDNQGALWVWFKDKLYRLVNGNITVFTKNEIPALNE